MLTKYRLDLKAIFCGKFKLDSNLISLLMSKSSSFFIMYSFISFNFQKRVSCSKVLINQNGN